MRDAILSAAEMLFSTSGFNAVSIRDIAHEAGANPGSITYHFKSKDGLLLEIYKRHCGPMNRRRIELLVAALKLPPAQAARLAELLDFLHRHLTSATENIRAGEEGHPITLNFTDWQRVLAVQMVLARYVRAVAEPDALTE